jgi:hypothetical protein
VSSLTPGVAPQESIEVGSSARAVSPWKNPSYPARTHWGERAALEAKLQSWDRKIEAIAQKLGVLGNAGSRSTHERIYHQMMGARDQMAEAVRRMPGEAGSLYDEDHERLVSAEAALTRLAERWEVLKS